MYMQQPAFGFSQFYVGRYVSFCCCVNKKEKPNIFLLLFVHNLLDIMIIIDEGERICFICIVVVFWLVPKICALCSLCVLRIVWAEDFEFNELLLIRIYIQKIRKIYNMFYKTTEHTVNVLVSHTAPLFLYQKCMKLYL